MHQPFRALKQQIAATAKSVPVAPAARTPPAPQPEPNADELFQRAVAGVKPLQQRARERVDSPKPATPPRPLSDSDAEALAELCDLVSGNAPLDVTCSDEYVEGSVVGLDPRLLRRLRAGEYASQGHLDLHGMFTEEARAAVDSFLTKAYQAGKRCVLIVHGRGRNSKDQIPVLKTKVTTWLARGQWSRLILAFASARPCDGGAGALYVLLRRRRAARHAIRVTNGAGGG